MSGLMDDKKRLKILQVINFYSPRLGGPVHNIFNLSRYLAKFGHEVTVCSTDFKFDPVFVNASKESGINVVLFPCIGPVSQYSPEMKKWLEENVGKYDIMHLNNYWSYQNLIACRSAKRKFIPYVLSPRGCLPIQMKNYLIKFFFDMIFGKTMLGDASAIIGTTQMEIEQIRKKGNYRGEIIQIPNAVDMPPDCLEEKECFRKRYGVPQGNLLLLFLARIHKIKGLDLLIETYGELLKRRKDVTLMVSGPDGGYLDEARRITDRLGLQDKIIFTGPLYGRDKYTAYSSADIYILPSRYEIFGNTILEACSCGIPVIITDRCGIAPEIAGLAGEVVKFDKEELCTSIIKLLDEAGLREKYGKQGRQIVIQRFLWDKVARRCEEVYLELTEKKRG